MLQKLLTDLDSQQTFTGVRVIVTLNLYNEEFVAQEYSRLDIVVLRNIRPRGFGANHNRAFELCETGWFGVLNPDLRLRDSEPFTALMSSAMNIDNIGVIAPLIVSPQGDREDAVRVNLSPFSLISRHLMGQKKIAQKTDIAQRLHDGNDVFFWLAGMCLILNSNAFRAVKGFDEKLFLYCEDYDLCARLYVSGFAVAVDHSVEIIHDARRDSRRSLKHLRWHLLSLLRVWMTRHYWLLTIL